MFLNVSFFLYFVYNNVIDYCAGEEMIKKRFIYTNHANERFELRFSNLDKKKETLELSYCNKNEVTKMQNSKAYKNIKKSRRAKFNYYKSKNGVYFLCEVKPQNKEQSIFANVIVTVIDFLEDDSSFITDDFRKEMIEGAYRLEKASQLTNNDKKDVEPKKKKKKKKKKNIEIANEDGAYSNKINKKFKKINNALQYKNIDFIIEPDHVKKCDLVQVIEIFDIVTKLFGQFENYIESFKVVNSLDDKSNIKFESDTFILGNELDNKIINFKLKGIEGVSLLVEQLIKEALITKTEAIKYMYNKSMSINVNDKKNIMKFISCVDYFGFESIKEEISIINSLIESLEVNHNPLNVKSLKIVVPTKTVKKKSQKIESLISSIFSSYDLDVNPIFDFDEKDFNNINLYLKNINKINNKINNLNLIIQKYLTNRSQESNKKCLKIILAEYSTFGNDIIDLKFDFEIRNSDIIKKVFNKVLEYLISIKTQALEIITKENNIISASDYNEIVKLFFFIKNFENDIDIKYKPLVKNIVSELFRFQNDIELNFIYNNNFLIKKERITRNVFHVNLFNSYLPEKMETIKNIKAFYSLILDKMEEFQIEDLYLKEYF